MVTDNEYRIEYKCEPDYLYAYVEGKKDSLEISRSYWSEIVAECERNKLSRILIEENIEENVTASEMYSFATELPGLIGPSIVVAFVDQRSDHQDLNRFGELVANNRGLRSRVFNSIPEAEKWLRAN